MNRTLLAAALTTGVFAGVLSCGDSNEPKCDPAITSFLSVVLHPFETGSLNATLVDCNNNPLAGTLTYTSLDGGVATVSQNGTVSGVAFGSTTVTVSGGGATRDIPVEVIGHPFGTDTTSVPLAGGPYGIAISQANIALVTQLQSNTVTRATLPLTLLFGPSVTVGNGPAHVAFNPDGGLAYTTNQLDKSVTVIHVGPNVPGPTIPLGREAFNLIVSPDGNTVYATVDTGTVYLIDAGTNTVVDSFPAGISPNGLAFSLDGTLLYVSSRDVGHVVVYNTQSNTLVDTLVTGGMPQRLVVSPDGTELYIANETLGLDIWNLGTGTRVTTIAMGAYGLGLSPDGAMLYVAGANSGTITVVDRVSRAIVKTWQVPGTPRNVAFDLYGTQALVTNEQGWVTVLQ